MLTRTEVQRRLQTANLTKVAEAMGVAVSTIQRIRDGKDCAASLLEKVSDYYKEIERKD